MGPLSETPTSNGDCVALYIARTPKFNISPVHAPSAVVFNSISYTLGWPNVFGPGVVVESLATKNRGGLEVAYEHRATDIDRGLVDTGRVYIVGLSVAAENACRLFNDN